MVEVLHFSKVYKEDLALGNGTQQVRLADNSLQTLNEISFGGLLLTRTVTVTPSSTVQLSVSGAILAGDRVFGVTIKILTDLGTTGGLTSFDVGDSVLSDRWGRGIGITAGTTTGQIDFPISDAPIYGANTDVLLTADVLFDTTGEIEVKSHYFTLTHE